jgi:anti-anti-sigma factor
VTAPVGSFEYQANKGWATLILRPGLNTAQWSEIERVGTEIISRMEAERPRAVLVDLSPLNYMGSAMVALLVRCWKQVQPRQVTLVVVCPNPIVREVISLAGLAKVWPIVESREAALKELGVTRTEGAVGSWLFWLDLCCLAVAAVGVGLLVTAAIDRTYALGILFGGAILSFVLGLITVARTTSGTRVLGLGVVLTSVVLAVLGLLRG